MKKLTTGILMLFLGGIFLFAQSGKPSHLGKVLIIYYSYSANANTEKVAK